MYDKTNKNYFIDISGNVNKIMSKILNPKQARVCPDKPRVFH